MPTKYLLPPGAIPWMLKRASRQAQQATKINPISQPSCVRCSDSDAFAAASARTPQAYASRRRRNSKADHVGERIEFAPECALSSHRTRDAPIHRVKKVGNSNCDCRIVEIGEASVQSGQHRVIPAKQICYGKCAGKNVDAAPKAPAAERPVAVLLRGRRDLCR